MKFIIVFLLGVLTMANHLKLSDSPYLLQHADNPVDWYPWGDEAFEKAKKENRLIFLSIGYSTCHWCHVMERESFENEEIADILNKYFVSIKVDREEHPDIDKKYQKIYQIMHNRAGGWPLTIIMTPKGDVFYSATYIPPHFSQLGPGLKEILASIVNDWQNNPQKIENIAENLKEYLKNSKSFEKVKISDDILEKVISEALKSFDMKYGGMKGAPKFPMESSLDLLIDVYELSGNAHVLDLLNITFEKMAKGGIFDQVEGGFYRYSTDAKWEVPHFEKMLYNNANLPYEYLRMYEITENPLYREAAFRSLDEMIKRYRDENFLFFSASNAESEGKEGAYFVYTYEEVKNAFKNLENAQELMEYFGIKKYGNFNSKNNPTLNGEKPENYKKALKILREIRSKREFPFIDTKKITAWNAMMVSALLKAGCLDEKYKTEGFKTLDELIEKMYINNTLYHSYNKNENAKTKALLEDYAYLVNALIDAYEQSFDENYLYFAKDLINDAKEKFYKNRWYMNSSKDIEADFSDSAYASSLSVLAVDYIRLATLTYDIGLFEKGKEIIDSGSYFIQKYPLYYPTITKAYFMQHYGTYVISMSEPECVNWEYPYIEIKKGENYELCSVEKCIIKTDKLNKIKDIIKKR
ncbi:thymidylate kinase [Nautilia profundicola AmH]|uniref:Thymidylate kinase n=1 Tax=Nautilia profundicola (strain ATCC BAA-1463 / DSM 18972 / AmH) TaxID=598659 RepID=B9L8A7_NAUPA|nr:thioredoxin domain-containing protein [Nautilia profundicola]ACM92867.1 thymidylate kinase [Nautilia profundicola AmH]